MCDMFNIFNISNILNIDLPICGSNQSKKRKTKKNKDLQGNEYTEIVKYIRVKIYINIV